MLAASEDLLEEVLRDLLLWRKVVVPCNENMNKLNILTVLAEIIIYFGLAAEAADQVAGVEAALLLLLGLAALAEGIG